MQGYWGGGGGGMICAAVIITCECKKIILNKKGYIGMRVIGLCPTLWLLSCACIRHETLPIPMYPLLFGTEFLPSFLRCKLGFSEVIPKKGDRRDEVNGTSGIKR